MQVVRYFDIESLKPLAAQWNGLARGVPFRQWDWASTWWRHYSLPSASQWMGNDLFVLGVWSDDQQLLGLAPWFVTRSATGGRTLQFLGAGEVCSDYLSVLCQSGAEDDVGRALAEWLVAPTAETAGWERDATADRWDLIHMVGVDSEDRAIASLLRHLEQHNTTVHQRQGANCWRITLPPTFEDYLLTLSKTHRKSIRKALRRLEGEVELHLVDDAESLRRGFEILEHLHQSRWQTMGHAGCFASPRFRAFHQEVAPLMLAAGQLHLFWLEHQGVPIAAEYHLLGNDVVYAYTGGLNPEYLNLEPGRIAMAYSVEYAVERRMRAWDFLRGDEPYKANWRAVPRASHDVRIVAPHAAAHLRHSAWRAGGYVKTVIKSGLRRRGGP